jgi:hypothetical protein
MRREGQKDKMIEVKNDRNKEDAKDRRIEVYK